MGGIAARKARDILGNVEQVVGIEVLNAYQALFFRAPFTPGPATISLVGALEAEGVTPVEVDRPLYLDMERVCRLLRSGVLLSVVEETVGSLQ